LIEQIWLPEYQTFADTIDKRSLATHQNNSEKFSQRIYVHAWRGIRTCVAGTRENTKALALPQRPRLPDFTSDTVMDKSQEAQALHQAQAGQPKGISSGRFLGFKPSEFPAVARKAAEQHANIPGLGDASAQFLVDMAERLVAELAAAREES
jgi:hypothetical protein